MKNVFTSIGIIISFLVIAIAPSINANMQRDFVELTTEVCCLNSSKQTVKLTQQQADEVEELFDSLREQLNTTESREEAEGIFKDAVVELDKYGLLGGLSVKQAQRLALRNYKRSRFTNQLNLQKNSIDKGKKNYMCLIYGKTDNTYFQGLIGNLFCIPLLFLNFILKQPGMGLFLFLTMCAINFPSILFSSLINPFCIGSSIEFGLDDMDRPRPKFHPANGWVWSNGLNGIIEWQGALEGMYKFFKFMEPLGVSTTGVIGFTGIRIFLPSSLSQLYLGSALFVKINHY
jgi:hypothetical protein